MSFAKCRPFCFDLNVLRGSHQFAILSWSCPPPHVYWQFSGTGTRLQSLETTMPVRYKYLAVSAASFPSATCADIIEVSWYIAHPRSSLTSAARALWAASTRNALGFLRLVFPETNVVTFHIRVCTLAHWQNGRRFADDTFKRISLNENVRISIKISLKFVPKGPVNNNPALVQILAWCRSGAKPLSEPMMVSLLTHICVTRHQWGKHRCPVLHIWRHVCEKADIKHRDK